MSDLFILINLLLNFQAKHIFADFYIQNCYPYMYENKGNLRHPGGYLHAGMHAVFTFILLVGFVKFSWGNIVAMCLAEFLVHYLIDYNKVNVTKRLRLDMTKDRLYWDLLGFDQYLHQITYIGIAGYLMYSVG